MKVILVNGSVHEKGSTNRALEEMKGQFEMEGIETVMFWVGKNPIPDSLSNASEAPRGEEKTKEFLELARTADGFVFGGPVYYSNASGQLLSFMNRIFYGTDPKIYEGKVAVGITVARRAGTVPTQDQINHYFSLKQMIIPTSFYWNNVFGAIPTDLDQDREGLQNLRKLASNMSYVLKLIEMGKREGIEFPSLDEKKEKTNFIR